MTPAPGEPTDDAATDVPADPAVELRDLAVGIARRAGDEARRILADLEGPSSGREHALGSRTKSTETDPVTVVDTAVESYIRSELAVLRPDDGVLGEEQGGDDSRDGARAVTWIVDPVDGTVNLLYGLPNSAVSIAVSADGRVLAGVVHDVHTAETFAAALGQGATVTDARGTRRRLSVSDRGELAHALVGTGFSYDPAMRAEQGEVVARLLPRVRDIRRLGAAAMDLCYVAAGRLDAYYERCLKPWDYAAGALIAREAGAVVDESADDAVPTIATNAALAEVFRAELAGG